MAEKSKVVINLATGLEDAERVTVAFLVGGAAAEQGKQVTMFLTKEAVRLALPGHADAVACDGCPPLARLFEQYAASGGRAARLPDLLPGAQAGRGRARRERRDRRRDTALGLDRRERHRLQLLNGSGGRTAGIDRA